MTPPAILIPDGVEDWLRRTGPLHLLVGQLPRGWVDLTLTNATGRGEISAHVEQSWDNEGTRHLTISVHIPGDREPRFKGVETRAPLQLAPPRPVIRVAVNPVTGTPHIMNGAVGLTGCGRRPRHGHVEWKYATAETTETHILFHDTMCKKCLQWFKREYEIK